MSGTEHLDCRELDHVAELLSVGILRTDAAGRCLFANPWARSALGLTEDEAAGWGWIEGLTPEGRHLVREGLDGSASPSTSNTTLYFPATGRRLSCRWDPVEWVVSDGAGVETDVPGAATYAPGAKSGGSAGARAASPFLRQGYMAVLVDVTDAHRTEIALRRTTQELEERVRELNCLFEISRAVERSAGDLKAILRETVAVLPRSLRFSGTAWARISLDGSTYQSPEATGTPWFLETPILVHGERAGAIQVGYREEPPSGPGNPFLPEEKALLEAVAQRLGRTAERLRGRRLLREREDEMRERLTHLTRVSTMGEMASSIAHEVNQPLTAIATYAMACRRMVENQDISSSDVSDILARISDEALRAGGIIHRLKDMVRRQESRWTECDVNALIRDVEQLASVDARLHDVPLSFHLLLDLPPVLADGVQIQQVVLNLIRNGIDAVEDVDSTSRFVALRTGLDGPGWIRVSVEDNGCGLPAGIGRDIFQPFFTTKKEGMGMGLSISRSIVEAHHGHIGFKRNDGPGSTFFFTLPVLDDT